MCIRDRIIAFGFRPYDFVRYRGLYSGETQSGLFYMLVYCAFFVKWLWGKQEKQNKWLCFFYFLMAAGNVGFMILAGSRSGVLGAVVVTLVILTVYDCGKEVLLRMVVTWSRVVIVRYTDDAGRVCYGTLSSYDFTPPNMV